MITRTQAQIKNRRVSYQTKTGNRPWLSNAKEIRLTGETTPHSALVRATAASGVTDTAWIGFESLTLVDSPHQATIDALNAQRADLLTKVAGIDAALEALNSLE